MENMSLNMLLITQQLVVRQMKFPSTLHMHHSMATTVLHTGKVNVVLSFKIDGSSTSTPILGCIGILIAQNLTKGVSMHWRWS